MMGRNTRLPNDIGLYTRKSCDKQGELSLPAQERLCRQFIQQHLGLAGRPIHVYKDILSGTRPDRSGYQEMLADARAGKLRMVVFHKVNRFGRDAAEGLMAVQELRRLGVEVRVADFPTLDPSRPEGMFIFTFLLGAGQYEVENLGAEALKGMQEKVERGGWPFLAPDGYVNCREEIAPRKFRSWVAVNRYRAAIIRLIFRWYASGQLSLAMIVRRLNQLHDQRIAAGKRACLRASGKRWSVQGIYRILNNRFYLGEIEVEGWGPARRGNHPPIIPQALFDRVQQVLDAHWRSPTQSYVYLLQGLLWLESATPLHCTTVTKTGQVYTYYYHYTESGQRVYFVAGTIEDQVLAQIRSRVATLGEHPAAMLQQRIRTSLARLRQHAHDRMEGLAGERQRVLHFARKGKFGEAEVEAELNRLNTEQEWAERELARAQMVETMHEPLLAEASADIAALDRWTERTVEEQHQILTRLIQQVDIDAAGTVIRITWQLLWDLLWFAPLGPTLA